MKRYIRSSEDQFRIPKSKIKNVLIPYVEEEY